MSNKASVNDKLPGYAGFAVKRVIIIGCIAVFGFYGLIKALDLYGPSTTAGSDEAITATAEHTESAIQTDGHAMSETAVATGTIPAGTISNPIPQINGSPGSPADSAQPQPAAAPVPADSRTIHSGPAESQPQAAPVEKKPTASHQQASEPEATGHRPFAVADVKRPRGVLFVDAVIEPLNYELTQRFWGWRPNDIVDVTDNINNLQLGVLECTRRSSVILTERLSRTGATASFDRNLQQGMNLFMIKSNQYWLPSPEDKYKEGIRELKTYKAKLENGQASFYTRTDSLIPLLSVYEDLLGSCEENLVKVTEEDGKGVSYFMADDYFYYAKGVAMAMLPVLEAVSVDFESTLESRRGTDVLRHAIEALHHAIEINPIIITNSDLDGILANHRANMAAPISHGRFYLGVLIKTLST